MNGVPLQSALSATAYPGRGIVIGANDDGKAVILYFIMGRSENSRNRVFVKTEDGIRTQAYDPAKMADPSLIIYSPVRAYKNAVIVTNGDQTDTIYDHMASGGGFETALSTRRYEPDEPNWTPRISGMVSHGRNLFGYKLSILKAIDGGAACGRYLYSYMEPIPGVGHFIHTYKGDGSPLPSFEGEPETVLLSGSLDDLAETAWEALDKDNRVSLYAEILDPATGHRESRIINAHG